MMINQMLNSSGIKQKAVGNTDTPLVDAIQDESLAKFVVEASSFRVRTVSEFRTRHWSLVKFLSRPS